MLELSCECEESAIDCLGIQQRILKKIEMFRLGHWRIGCGEWWLRVVKTKAWFLSAGTTSSFLGQTTQFFQFQFLYLWNKRISVSHIGVFRGFSETLIKFMQRCLKGSIAVLINIIIEKSLRDSRTGVGKQRANHLFI